MTGSWPVGECEPEFEGGRGYRTVSSSFQG